MDRYYGKKYPTSVSDAVKTDTHFFNKPISDVANRKSLAKEKVKQKNQEVSLDAKILIVQAQEISKTRRSPIRRSDSRTCFEVRRVI